MAVQKSKVTRSRRNMRRSHDALANPTLSIDVESGEIHLRHCITPNGFYRGRRALPQKKQKVKAEQKNK
jgi:large subunit ribosomal protein L32